MDLRQLRYFVAVAEKLHFGHAAESVNVVQSAISQQIKLLEEELRVVLLERSRPNVKLTEAGRRFLPECKRVLLQAEEAMRVAKQASAGYVGRIRVGFVDNALWSLLPPLIREFRDRFAEVDLELLPLDRGAQIRALEDHAIDIGITPTPRANGAFQGELFADGPLMIAVGNDHPLLRSQDLTMERLAEYPFVMFPMEFNYRVNEIVLAACSEAGFTPNIAQVAAQMHTQLALVGAGFGLAFVPWWVAEANFQNVSFVQLRGRSLNYGLEFIWRMGDWNAALQNFAKLMREFVRQRGVLRNMNAA
jgi:DNA-binding transcriptional LysR family regulator